jgi:putative transposase
MLIFGERHLHPVLAEHVAHYKARRPYRAPPLRPTCPEPSVAELGHRRIRRRPELGGLIDEYERAA